jgi:hypothetical protein
MRAWHALGVIAVGAAALSDCLDPTEIELVISTDVACSSVDSTAIAVGPTSDDQQPVSATTSACSDAGIGTLVITPSRAIDDSVGIRVTMGVGGTPGDQCVAPDFAGCIVARRQLRYDPHHPLTLPVKLQGACLNHPCDPNSTCVSGTCVDAGIPSCDETGTCVIDAGPPCGLPPTLVVPSQDAVTPHLVRTATGFAVGHDTAAASSSQREYHVTLFDASGSNTGDVKLNQTPIMPGESTGALGEHGSSFIGTYVDATGLLQSVVVDETGKLVGGFGVGAGYEAPRAGLFDDPGLPGFGVLGIGPKAGLIFMTIDDTTGQGNGAVADTGVLGTDPALALWNGVYYAAYHDASTCSLLSFIRTSSTFDEGTPTSWPGCTMVRYGENAPGTSLYATRSAAGQLQIATNPASPGTTLGPADDQAVVVIPEGGTRFRVVWRSGGDILDARIDTSAPTAAGSIVVGATAFNGLGAGFDAIAETNAPSWDLAYWASAPVPGVYFTRLCQ